MKPLLRDNIGLMKEYNKKRNIGINIDKITSGSSKKIWWICDKGHEWQASIKHRVNGSNCPYCSNHILLKGYNDLATTNSELAKEWNYEKNKKLTPNDVKEGAHTIVWWKCKKGHEYRAAINQRAYGSNCPYCSNRKLLIGYNDLATVNPELAREWNYEKNGLLKPTDVMSGTKRVVWWKCKKGHEYKTQVSVRNKGHDCPVCNDETQTSLPERIVYYYIKKYIPTAINNYVPDNFNKKSLDIYIPNYSTAIEYDGSHFHQNLKKDLDKDILCKKNNIKLYRIREYKLSNKNYESESIKIVLKDSSYICLEDAIRKILNDLNIYECDISISRDLDRIYQFINFIEKKDSLLNLNPKLAEEWNYEKNGSLKPSNVTLHSGKRVWWKCKEGHEWQAEINSRSKGRRCPYCTNMKLKIGYNDLASKKPELLKEWDYDKNSVKPNNVLFVSSKKVWWICKKCGNEWETSIKIRSLGHGCPLCANRENLKKIKKQ